MNTNGPDWCEVKEEMWVEHDENGAPMFHFSRVRRFDQGNDREFDGWYNTNGRDNYNFYSDDEYVNSSPEWCD